jgi:urease accessory protein
MIAELHIEAANKKGKAVLQKAWFTSPFKVLDITEDRNCRTLHLMVMNASPGILDGDVYAIQITVLDNCRLHLHTQAYQRLFQMQEGASQLVTVRLAPGGAFYYLPHPSVPHASSHFTTCNKFYLHRSSTLVFGEVLTCGRKLNGEAFRFSKYHSITEIFIENRLVIKENLLMQPHIINPNSIGQLEGYTHQASMIWLQPDIDPGPVQQQILESLATEKDIAVGVSEAPVQGLCIRLMGYGAEQLHHCLHNIYQLLPSPFQPAAVYAP